MNSQYCTNRHEEYDDEKDDTKNYAVRNVFLN